MEAALCSVWLSCARKRASSNHGTDDGARRCHIRFQWLLDHPLSRMMTAEKTDGDSAEDGMRRHSPSGAADLAEDVGELLLHLLHQFGARARDHGEVLEPLERPAGVDDGARIG